MWGLFLRVCSFQSKPFVVDVQDGLHDDVGVNDLINHWSIFIDADSNREQEAHIEDLFLK